jgi:hypothetical protein
MPVLRKDYIEQRAIYSYHGGLWRVAGYIDGPSVTMENIQTKGQMYFGIQGLTHDSFEEVPQIHWSRENQCPIIYLPGW